MSHKKSLTNTPEINAETKFLLEMAFTSNQAHIERLSSMLGILLLFDFVKNKFLCLF